MGRRLLAVLFFACLATSCLAQGGREFWFAAPEVSVLHADSPILLRVSSFDRPAQITVSQPANRAFAPITVSLPANGSTTVDLTSRIEEVECKPANAVLNKGLYIQSTTDINVYYEVQGNNSGNFENSDIFVLKGGSGLGKEFYVPMQTFWSNRANLDAWASFDIVATENNTTVTLLPSKPLFPNHPAGVPFSIRLNRGQTYSARASTILAVDRPAGTKVVADKPIAITYKDDSMFQPATPGASQAWDLAGDQLLPVTNIGTSYVAIRSSLPGNRNDRVFFCATKNNTQLYIGSDTVVLQEGETYNYLLQDSAAYFRASDSLYAFHISAFWNELGGAILPPLACTGSKSVVFVRSNMERFVLSILVKAGGEGGFALDGVANPFPVDSFRVVPFSEGKWKYAQIVYEEEMGLRDEIQHILKNSSADFHLGVLNGGVNSGLRYGYFSDFGFLNLNDQKSFCQGQSLELDASTNKDKYLWSTQETTPTITVRDSGTYWLEVTKEECTYRDTIRVGIYPPIVQAILGNDTAACVGSNLIISTLTPFFSYRWQNNASAPTIRPKSTGWYKVTVTDTNGCAKSDSLYVTLYPSPTPEISHASTLESFCADSVVTLSVSPNFKTYRWFNGATTSTITTTRTPNDEYEVAVTSAEGCVGKNKIALDCSPFFSVPNVFTPNADGYNDVFRIRNWRPDAFSLKIYNRWGGTVYTSDPYQNDWSADGTPDGVYFYSIRTKNGDKENKGWVQVIR